MEKTKLLLVEDDLNLGQILKEYLEIKDYSCVLCKDGMEGIEAFRNTDFDLCILDIMLPKKDGFTLAKEIRMTDKDVPIIFLTAKSMKEDTIAGFKSGADDYITKPFIMEELILRIKAILRRTKGPSDVERTNLYKLGQFIFDYDNQLLKTDSKTTKLTSKEAELLKLLALNMNQTLERRAALKLIWRDDSYFNARSMDVYIAKLRKLLSDDEKLQILNIHGEGFRLVFNK